MNSPACVESGAEVKFDIIVLELLQFKICGATIFKSQTMFLDAVVILIRL